MSENPCKDLPEVPLCPQAQLSRLKAAFDALGIKYTEDCSDPERIIIRIGEGIGYQGFFTDFNFRPTGEFEDYGVWE
jgi:hypothetical protein